MPTPPPRDELLIKHDWIYRWAKNTFIARYVDWAYDLCSAPPDYHAAVAFGLLSSAVQRRIWLDHAGGRLFPNLWLCLIGDSGRLCKSTALNLGVRVLRHAVPECLYPTDFSVQKFYTIMAKIPQGTLVYREFKNLSGILSRDYMSGAKALFTDLFDNPPDVPYETLGGGSILIKDPSLVIWAASTEEWFTSRETQKDLAGGYLARFIWLPARVSDCRDLEALPDGEEDSATGRDLLAAELSNIHAAHGRCRLSLDGASAYKHWVSVEQEMSPLREGLLAPFFMRYINLALKLSLLLHVAAGRDTYQPIDEATMVAACDTVDRWQFRLADALQEGLAMTMHEEQRNRVLRLIPNGGQEASQRTLLRSLHWRVKDLGLVLEALQAEGKLSKRIERIAGGSQVLWRRTE